MKKLLAISALVLSIGLGAALDAQAAKRLGGGKSSGMQRDNVTQPAKPGAPAGGTATPGQAPAGAAATAPAAGAAAAAAAPKRSWMGPLAGLAAGLGLAALASHFGFGEALANMMMIGLLVMVALLAVGYFMRKRAAGNAPAYAPAGAGSDMPQGAMERSMGTEPAPQATQPSNAGGSSIGSGMGSRIGSGLVGTTAAATTVGQIPADFDTAGFARNAQENFLALQAANDARDLDKLRTYLTPEMFESVREDIASRDDTPQKTEVFGLQAQVLDVAQEAARYVVSVRFTGSIRHAFGAEIEDLAEVWHLTKPRDGAGGWIIAGIQQA